MIFRRLSNRSARGLKLMAAFLVFQAIGLSISRAEITTDGTLGPAMALTGPDYLISKTLGTQKGDKLFHSFTSFDIYAGQSATFTGPASVEAIISRVTGGTASTIDGALKSAIEGADFYLLNPAGVMFGPHASLDISGSFHVSTADYLAFKDGARFCAALTENSTLSFSPLSAFGFLTDTAAPISFAGSGSNFAMQTDGHRGISVPEGETLSIIGGDITVGSGLHGGVQPVESLLKAPRGRIDVVSVQSTGEVVPDETGVTLSAFENFGDIFITNGAVMSVTGDGAGTLAIHGGNLVMGNSTPGDFPEHPAGLYATSQEDGHGGGIVVRLAGDLEIQYGAEIMSNGWGAGGGRKIDVAAENIAISGAGKIYAANEGSADGTAIRLAASEELSITENSYIFGFTNGDGRGSDVRIEANRIDMKTGGNIDCSTYGPGQGGMLSVFAQEFIHIDGFDQYNSGMYATAISSGNAGSIKVDTTELHISDKGIITGETFGTGRGADIFVTAAHVVLTGGGRIDVNTYGPGQGGNLEVAATGKIDISGLEDATSMIAAQVYGTGDAGHLSVSAPFLTMSSLGAISATAYEESQGHGAEIRIDADNIELHDFSFISANALGAGNGGDMDITGKAILLDGSYMSTSSTGDGDGGNIRITAEQLTVDNAALISAMATGDGHGGFLNLQIDRLAVKNNGRIAGGTAFGTGNAGDILIDAKEDIIFEGTGGEENNIALLSGSAGFGDGGNISISAPVLSIINGAAITGQTEQAGDSGQIDITVGRLLIDHGEIINNAEKAATGNGGDIFIHGSDAIEIKNGGKISAKTEGAGNGGKITIQTTGEVLISGGNLKEPAFISCISMDTENAGDAGDIYIETGNLILENGFLATATLGSGDAGEMRLTVSDTIRLNADNDGANTFFSSNTFGSGRGGNMVMDCTRLILQDGATIFANTGGSGRAGDITIRVAEDMEVRGRDESTTTIASGTLAKTEDGGDAGDIFIHARNLSFIDGGRIDSSTAGGGLAGNINIDIEERLYLSGSTTDGIPSGITALAGYSGPEYDGVLGRPGDIRINAGEITMENGAWISTLTHGAEKSGAIYLHADDAIRLSGKNPVSNFRTIITANTYGAGHGGNIEISAENLFLSDGGAVEASARGEGNGGDIDIQVYALSLDWDATIYAVSYGAGAAGNIVIDAADTVTLDYSSLSTQAVYSLGGDIRASAESMIRLTNSSISTSVGGGIGNGGNISIDPDFVILKNSWINANAHGGNGGNISIVADQFIADPISRVTASSELGIDGNVAISSPIIDFAGIESFAVNFFDVTGVLSTTCESKSNKTASTLVAKGRGGVPLGPEDAVLTAFPGLRKNAAAP